jgi:UDP-N-acetylmuramate-alanine ligase
VAWLPSFADANRFLDRALSPEDVCVFMGAGDIDRLARDLVSAAGQ